MTITFPYTLENFASLLKYDSATIDLRRGDEVSGTGDGRYWSAELHRPLWTALIPLATVRAAEARSANARVRALDGMRRQFAFSDPVYTTPAGGALGGATVTISAIGTDRGRISLAGLPPAYRFAAGDYFSVVHGSGRVYFGEFSEDGVASGGGAVASIEIRPYLSLGIAVGASVRLIRPIFHAVIQSFTPYTINKDGSGSGASITLLQKP